MRGKIVKGIAGFYYVYSEECQEIYECKARGLFRKDGIKPLVGDNVEIEVGDAENHIGNIMVIAPRRNACTRPAVANIDQAMVVFAIVQPAPNLNLLDRFLVTMEKQDVPCLICFNKEDLATGEMREELRNAYEGCGFQVIFCSAEMDSMQEIKGLLKNKTTVLAGPSGVGKSSILNRLCPEAGAQTAALSRRIARGRHTTRHAEIFALGDDTYICDTPGFTALYLGEMDKEELKRCYAEFAPYAEACRFRECAHLAEPDCGVKLALERGDISQVRYRNYVRLYEELKFKRRPI